MKTISFKVTEDEDRLIRSRAAAEQLSLSDFLRRRAMLPNAPAQKPRQMRCPHTGAMIFSGFEHDAPLTGEQVREILADFP